MASRFTLFLFASTIGLSAFLLFLVQPIIAKQILPWFGGSAAVWTTCMVFFQLVLLAGYFYSDLVIRKLAARQQALLHGSLLLLSLLALPITPSETFKPDNADHPIGRILLLLGVTIGLPYLMLSTTGPLIQAWFARRFAGTTTAASVWRLYALSNVASMLALVVYPPLIEPSATSRMQSLGWGGLYLLFVLVALGSAWTASRQSQGQGQGPRPEATDPLIQPAPSAGLHLLWMSLAALGSVLLLTVTIHTTQNIASIPFLWVLPLAIYLATFILTFDGKEWYWPRTFRLLTCLIGLALLAALRYRLASDWDWGDEWSELYETGLMHIHYALPLYTVGLFVLCMFCHGELVARKPAATHLTRFYLMVSLGGAIGGLLVGVVAPLTLNWYWEFPAALCLSVFLVVCLSSRWWRLPAAIAFGGCAGLVYYYSEHVHENTVEMTRNFYGALSVKAAGFPDDPKWRLQHGVITHGEQFRREESKRMPTTYYGAKSGVGRAIETLRIIDKNAPQRVGLIGLGVGTIATYGRAGDTYRVYELNPAVLELATRRFTYLADSQAKIEPAIGDARLILEREPSQQFDLLAVDAFSSDSIPVHLITREAMSIYRRHLREGGVIAFHISNRYLNLAPITRQLADESGMQALHVVDDPPDDDPTYRSDWVLITSNKPFLEALRTEKIGEEIAVPVGIRSWTDDYNNLFDVLK